jgi:uncharacterized membrane protein
LTVSIASLGCGSNAGAEPEQPGLGTATGASCDPSLSYDNFGQSFMQSYCTNCHASALTGAARHGAPLDHDFDRFDKIQAYAEHIDEYAAAGPDNENDFMPPSGASPSPSLQERQTLGAWLACGPVD